jgi:hypothetical protein
MVCLECILLILICYLASVCYKLCHCCAMCTLVAMLTVRVLVAMLQYDGIILPGK